MWELDRKEGRALKNWCFWIVVLQKTLESPLESNEIKLVNLKGINPEYSWEEVMLKLQYFGYLMRRGDSLDMDLSKLQEIEEDRKAQHTAVHGITSYRKWLNDCNARDLGSISRSGRSAGERLGYPLQCSWASLVAQLVKNLPAMQETWVRSLGWEDPLEKGKATHSSILAWRIPWTEEPGGL